MVEADISDEASVTKAFDGAYGAFLVTNFWAHMSPEQEKQDAADHGAGRQDRRPDPRDLVHA